MKASSALKQAAASKPVNEDRTIKGLVTRMKPGISAALPKAVDPERFTRILLTAISSNPKLQECSSTSFLGAMMQAAQLGLEPNTPLGLAYLIPYRNKGVMEAQFQIGYKGLLELAYRTGEYKDIYAHAVYENDVFEYELGLEQKLVHKPAMTNRGNVIAYYAVYHLTNGGYGMFVMSYDDVVKHKNKYSKATNSPWNSDFDAMAKKTVLKQLLKYAPKAADLSHGMSADESVKHVNEADVEADIDMSMVHNDADVYDISPVPDGVDPETGEIVGTGDADMDAILNGGK